MNRKKMLLRNVLVILLFASIYVYFNGMYLSKDAYITDAIRSFHLDKQELVAEVEMKDETVAILFDTDKMKVSILGIKKHGFFYYPGNSTINLWLPNEGPVVGFIGFHGGKNDRVYCFYRKDMTVDHVEVEFENGMTYVTNEWKDDFATVYVDTYQSDNEIYKFYDKENNLIEEY